MCCNPPKPHLRKNVTLTCRVRSYIRNGWADNIVYPDQPLRNSAANVNDADQVTISQQSAVNNWKVLKTAFTSPGEVPSFSHGQMVTYFVSRTVSDGLPAGDFKAMNAHAQRLQHTCGSERTASLK